jgi:hypothetical protein
MDKTKMVKIGMTVLGLALTAAANFVSGKNQETAMKEEIAKQVAEALAGQTSES